MKKVLFALLVTMFVISAQAQRIPVETMTGSGDTVTNTGSKSLTYDMINSYYPHVSIHLSVSRISGTLDGTAVLLGSNNDSTWYPVVTDVILDTSGITVKLSDTVDLTNVAAVEKIWIVDPGVYKHYKVTVTGAGTMSARIAGVLCAFKND